MKLVDGAAFWLYDNLEIVAKVAVMWCLASVTAAFTYHTAKRVHLRNTARQIAVLERWADEE